MPYEYDVDGGVFVAQGQYGFPDYPDGQLRTSAAQLSRFLMMFAQGGTLGGVKLLEPTTVAEMRAPQHPPPGNGQGLIWYYSRDQTTQVLGHSGTYYGASTDMWFDPLTGAGYVLLMNGGVYFDYSTGPQMDAVYQIDDKLLSIAEAL